MTLIFRRNCSNKQPCWWPRSWLNNFEAGSFSETTTASFSADFKIGAVDGKGIVLEATRPVTVASTVVTDGDEAIEVVYSFQIDLSTSFTGEDSLDISLDAGNAVSTGALGELDLNAGEELSVDGVSYTFPVGGLTAFVGDNTDEVSFTTQLVFMLHLQTH